MTKTTRRHRLAAAVLAPLAALAFAGPAEATFPGENGVLRAVDADSVIFAPGSNSTLTPEVGTWSDPRATADGRRLFATYLPPAGEPGAGVWSMRPDGTDRVQITSSPADRHPAPAPNGQRLVVSNDGALWSIGAGPLGSPSSRKLLFRVAGLRAEHPDVSPDGAMVAFDVAANGHTDVWVLDLATLAARSLTATPKLDDEGPSWSPDGRKIAFASNRPSGQNWDIHVATAPRHGFGSPAPAVVVRFTNGPAQEREPAWSPNGSVIAFTRDGQLATVNTSGDLAPVTQMMVTSPDWAPAVTVPAPAALPCTIVIKEHGDAVVTVNGTAGRDVICGAGGPERIDGAGGNDVIRSGAGNDEIMGSAGDDWIDAGSGDDALDGGEAGDVLRGGAGADSVSYARRDGDVFVLLDDDQGVSGSVTVNGSFGEGDRIDGVEVALGGAGNDTLIGTSGADTLDGGRGADAMRGGGGLDVVTYASRKAPVTVTPGDGLAEDGEEGERDDVSGDVEQVTGGAGDDHLEASALVPGAVLVGGRGDDRLVGGPFAGDRLLGQEGADLLIVGGDGLSDQAVCGTDGTKPEPEDVVYFDPKADEPDADCEERREK